MNLLNYTLLVGVIAIVVGILICLGILSAMGKLQRGGSSQGMEKGMKGAKGGKALYEMDQLRLREIYTLISKVTATLKYERVLEIALDLGSRVLATPNIPAENLVSAVLLFAESEYEHPVLTVGSARHFTQSDLRVTLPGTGGLIGEVIAEGAPRSSNDLARDPELSRIVALRACKVAYCLPLRAGLDTYGILFFAHTDPNFFTPSALAKIYPALVRTGICIFAVNDVMRFLGKKPHSNSKGEVLSHYGKRPEGISAQTPN